MENEIIRKDKMKTTIVTEREIRYRRIEGTEFAVYEEKRKVTTDGDAKEDTMRGLASIKAIENTKGLNKINAKVDVPKMYQQQADLILMPAETLKNIRSGKQRVSDAVNGILEKIRKDGLIKDDLKIPEGYGVLLYNWGSEKLARPDFKFVSLPIHFGYMDGIVNNKEYELEKLLEKLKTTKGVLDKNSLEITPIPYYNCHDGIERSVEFDYLLDDDVYDSLMEKKWDSFALKHYILSEIIGTDECKAASA